MTTLRILLVEEASPFRDAIAGALANGGYQVSVAESFAGDSKNEFAADTVVYGEGFAQAAGQEAKRQIELRRPVNMEELRRALRDG